ncbi:MAG: hypothetical protein IT256_07220 [Chitinophagaceae bacterium]|nr:hypothetical protein [Chitinophagaceae bacterium]
MYLKPAKVLLLINLPFWGIGNAIAQNIDRPFENAPYSRYGIGEQRNDINPALKAMGSITAAYADPYIINTDNPASYASLKHFTYEAGLTGSRRTILSSNSKYQTGGVNLSYLNLAIPMGKYAGMVIGYKANSKVGYSLYDTLQSLIGPASISYNGTGGTNYFFVGGAGKYKGFSLGLNVGYLFGTINQTSWYKTNSTAYYVNNSEFLRRSSIGGLYLKSGAMYQKSLGKDYMLNLGGQANMSQSIGTELSEYWISHPFYASDTSGSDTAYAKKGIKETIVLPSELTFGAQIAKSDKWSLGVNYKTTNWSQFNNQNLKDSIGANAYKVSIGGEYTPNSISLYNYWQRITYRAGFYYGKDFVQINNKQANYYAATFGLSLPFKRSTDRIQTALEIGKMGTQSATSIQQNFVRFSIGISFNDKSWFVKRKYD